MSGRNTCQRLSSPSFYSNPLYIIESKNRIASSWVCLGKGKLPDCKVRRKEYSRFSDVLMKSCEETLVFLDVFNLLAWLNIWKGKRVAFNSVCEPLTLVEEVNLYYDSYTDLRSLGEGQGFFTCNVDPDCAQLCIFLVNYSAGPQYGTYFCVGVIILLVPKLISADTYLDTYYTLIHTVPCFVPYGIFFFFLVAWIASLSAVLALSELTVFVWRHCCSFWWWRNVRNVGNQTERTN